MKKSIVFLATVLAMSLLACQDAKDGMKKNISDLAYFQNVGNQIPNETGVRWVTLYRERNHIASRTTLSGYSIMRDELSAVMTSAENAIGVAFQHGEDADGVHHFIVVPIDEALSLWNGSEGRVFVDANTNTIISKEVAHEWALRYQQSNPDQIRCHFFGKNIMDQIAAVPFFDELVIEPAVSDVDQSPQLLLILNAPELLSGESIGGRSESEESQVYDGSWPNPPGPIE